MDPHEPRLHCNWHAIWESLPLASAAERLPLPFRAGLFLPATPPLLVVVALTRITEFSNPRSGVNARRTLFSSAHRAGSSPGQELSF